MGSIPLDCTVTAQCTNQELMATTLDWRSGSWAQENSTDRNSTKPQVLRAAVSFVRTRSALDAARKDQANEQRARLASAEYKEKIDIAKQQEKKAIELAKQPR